MRSPIRFNLFSLALIACLFLTSLPALAAPPVPATAASSPSARQRLQAAAGDVQISIKNGLGTASFVSLARNGVALNLSGANLQARAVSFFTQYGELFGIRDVRGELTARTERRDLAGGLHIPFAQTYRGLPVFGGQLIVHFDRTGRFVAANGAFVPDIAVDVQPALTAEQAGQAALAVVAAANPDATNTAFAVTTSELLIYRTGLIQGVSGQSHLAYRVEVSNSADVRDQAFIDAASGALLDRFPMQDNALYRELYDRSMRNLVWKEGDAWPSNAEYQTILDGTAEMYNLIGSLTNGAWLSYNGVDARMKSIANYKKVGYCPNASWNGVNTQFCTGISGDDTVAHEWGHAYTEYTHNLMYAWQPGALNESYSDIWGETVDLLNSRGSDVGKVGPRSTDGAACSALACGSNAPQTDNSMRWVSGEDDPGFPDGCPIRDLWRPECYDNPGKVLSSAYYCSTGDGGGVHYNSGVPNHAFALTVDGGTYNGQTITGIGLTKAAHLYWHAQTNYQTNITDFADHADALAASCQDLIGQPLYELKTTATGWGATTPAITQADCDQVAKVALAVQFRSTPACNFTPMFDPKAPALCTVADETPQNHLFQDFEAGLGAWTTQQAPSNPGTWTNRPWTVKTNAPDGHPGQVAFGPDPIVGDCSADLENGRTSLLSPVISIPADAKTPVRLAWDHLVSMEIEYDGGNLKASVNSGAFTLVPASAFTFNPYNSSLETAAGGNNNPLAGEAAWTGGDGGAVSSKWGQSQIDLSRIGVDPGDTVQFRWDIGSDGCNGWEGWYVDDVRVYSCVASPCTTPASPTNLTITKANATTINLNWAATTGATQYEVWTASNTPYFDPTGKTCASPAPYACSTTAGTAYSAADLGDAAVNHAYVTRSANTCGQTSGPSNRTGEFDFALVKGG